MARDDVAVERTWRSLLPAAVLGSAAALANFDVTAVVVVMPAIAADLRLGAAGSAWVMDAYSLAFTGTLLLAGALADRHGRRRALLYGGFIFLVSSIGCGVASNGAMLWAARAAQGVGAAFMVTGGLSLIAHLYQDADARTRAFGLVGVLSGAAMALGPSVGGLIASGMGWRVIFLANVPLCLIMLALVVRRIDETRDPTRRPLDGLGVALLTLALAVAVESLLQAGTAVTIAAAGLGVSGLLLGAFVFQQRRSGARILEPAIFCTPAMTGIALLLFAVSFGYWAVLVYLPSFLAATFQWTAAETGMGLLLATLPMLFLPPLGARLCLCLGWRRLFAIAMLLMLVGDVLLAVAAGQGSDAVQAARASVAAGMLLIGAGAAFAHPQLSRAVVELAPPAQSGMASAVTVVVRQAGFALGIAALGATVLNDSLGGTTALTWWLAALGPAIGCVAALVSLPGKSG